MRWDKFNAFAALIIAHDWWYHYKHALCSTFFASGENMRLECTYW